MLEGQLREGKCIIREFYRVLSQLAGRAFPSKPIYESGAKDGKPGKQPQIDLAKTRQHILETNPPYQKHFLNKFFKTQIFDLLLSSNFKSLA